MNHTEVLDEPLSSEKDSRVTHSFTTERNDSITNVKFTMEFPYLKCPWTPFYDVLFETFMSGRKSKTKVKVNFLVFHHTPYDRLLSFSYISNMKMVL